MGCGGFEPKNGSNCEKTKMKVDSPNHRNGKVQSANLGTICDLAIIKFQSRKITVYRWYSIWL